MQTKKTALLAVALVVWGGSVLALQNGPAGTRKITEYEQDYDEGKPEGDPKIRLEQVFDANGLLIEETEYKDGKKDRIIAYQYDKTNHKIKEVEKNTAGKITRTTDYKYANGVKTERTSTNSDGQIKSKRTYKYE